MQKNLIDFRIKKSLTQKEIAFKLGITVSYYIKIELGERNPSYNFLNKFKKKFHDAKIDDIFF